MDLGELKQTLSVWVMKYRWAVMVVLAGILLLCIPGKETDPPEQTEQTVAVEHTLQQELEEILSRVEGAGKVRLLLTVATGEQIHYQTDEDTAQGTDSADLRRETVLITGASREQTGLVRRVDPPAYQGAVVVSQGADRATVRLALVEAVKTATGLTADKISVLKMK